MSREFPDYAFPCPEDGNGMTLRDYFAAAVIGSCPSHVAEWQLKAWFKHSGVTNEEIRAKQAYLIADAMLKERIK